MTINPQWRVMCFDPSSEELIQTIGLGSAPLHLVRENIRLNDAQEMCGSYELSQKQLEWISNLFQNEAVLVKGFDMFLERET